MRNNKYCSSEEIPECCTECDHIDSDSKDDNSPYFYYCTMGMCLPFNKQTCKRQNQKVKK